MIRLGALAVGDRFHFLGEDEFRDTCEVVDKGHPEYRFGYIGVKRLADGGMWFEPEGSVVEREEARDAT